MLGLNYGGLERKPRAPGSGLSPHGEPSAARRAPPRPKCVDQGKTGPQPHRYVILATAKSSTLRAQNAPISEVSVSVERRFQLVLVKPSHYDDDGYVIRWWRAIIPSNSLAAIYSIAADCA